METTAEATLRQRFVRGCREPATLRLLVVAAAIAVCSWVTYQARAALEPPAVEPLTRDYNKLPLRLGEWTGLDKELDPKKFAAIGAEYVVNRIYRSSNGRYAVSLHLAVFKKPDDGIRHSPMNCYRAEGMRDISTKRTSLNMASEPDMDMLLTTWEKDQKRVLVGYWFKMGEHLLFDRTDMAGVRWALRGQQVWPAMVKVLIHYDPPGSAPTEEDAERLREFAVMVEKWISAPDDQAALQLLGGAAAESRARRAAEEETPPSTATPPAAPLPGDTPAT
jgi:hypothetical protein